MVVRHRPANCDTNGVGVYRLPKKLDEEVARLHLDRIGVLVEGSYKAEHYRY